jgi:curved DNA-binding protein CbpA
MEQSDLTKGGTLQDRPLVETLREVKAESLTGSFRLAHERIKSVIYCNEGAIVYALSNVRSMRLSQLAQRMGILNEEQIAQIGEKPTDIEFGEALLKAGFLNKSGLEALLVTQTMEVLRPALLWTTGSWDFDGRVRIVESMCVNVPTDGLLAETARRLPPEYVATRFSNQQEKLSPRQTAVNFLQLQPIEAFILSRIDMPLQLNELLAISGMPEAVTLHAVYTLAFAEFIEREWPAAFTPEEIQRLRSAKLTVKTATASKPVFQQAQQTPAAKPLQANQTSVAEKTTQPIMPEVDQRKEVEDFLARIERARNFYEVLGLERQAEDSEIKRAYHTAAKKYHPDRFHHEIGTSFHSRLQIAFARVAQAYDTLKDAKTRTVYDHKLGRQEVAGATGAQTQGANKEQMAEERFQQALKVYKQNNIEQALPLFGQAVRLAPNQARYHAHYGQALAHNQQMRRQAETEFQEAIKLDSKNVAYSLMLAEFYRDQKHYKRAQSVVQRALTIDPNNKDARRLLDELENK